MLNRNYIESFENNLLGKQKSKNTVRNYICDVNSFYNYIDSREPRTTIDKIKQMDVEDYLYGLSKSIKTKKSSSPATINRKISTLKKFFEFLQIRDIVQSNPVVGIENVELDKREMIYMNDDDIQKFINYVKLNCNKREIAFSVLFLETGLRLFEAVSLNIDDIKFDTRELKINGKGRKERILFLNDSVLNAIKDYMEFERKGYLLDSNEKALFLSCKGTRINQKSLEKIFKDIFTNTFGKDTEYTIHKLRHTFASKMYEKEKDIVKVKGMLGHSDVSTTQQYVHEAIENRKEAMLNNSITNF